MQLKAVPKSVSRGVQQGTTLVLDESNKKVERIPRMSLDFHGHSLPPEVPTERNVTFVASAPVSDAWAHANLLRHRNLVVG